MVLVFALFLSLVQSQASPVCAPRAVAPLSDSVWSSGAVLRRHFILATPYQSPWTLSRVEYAQGVREVIPGTQQVVGWFAAAPNQDSFAFHTINGTVLSARSSDESPVEIVPPNFVVNFDHYAFRTLNFSPDSRWVVLSGQFGSDNPSLWVVPLVGGASPVLLSNPAHSSFRTVFISPDSSRVLYTIGTATNATRLFSVSILGGGNVVELSVTATNGLGVEPFAIAFSPDSSMVAYVSAPFEIGKKRVFVVSSQGGQSREVSINPLASGSSGYTGGLSFTSDGSLLFFRGVYREFSQRGVIRWVAARTDLANSSYPISVASNASVSNSHVFVPPRGLAYIAAVPDTSAKRALFLIDIADDADALRINGTILSRNNGTAVQSVVAIPDRFIGFVENDNLMFVPANGNGSQARQISPDGPVDVVIGFASDSVVFRLNYRTFYVSNVATGSLTAQAVSLSNQSLSLLYPSPNAISAVFFTSSDREVFVTCLIPPVIVRTNQTLLVNTSTSIGGHLILEDSTSVLAFTIGSGVTVAGTAILNGGVLAFDSCVTGNFSVVNANHIVGSFGSVVVSNCNCQTFSSSASYTSSSVTLSIVVNQNSPTCPSSAAEGLSRAAIIGIATSCSIVFAVAVIIGGVFLYKSRVRARTAAANADLRLEEMASVSSVRPNPHNQ